MEANNTILNRLGINGLVKHTWMLSKVFSNLYLMELYAYFDPRNRQVKH